MLMQLMKQLYHPTCMGITITLVRSTLSLSNVIDQTPSRRAHNVVQPNNYADTHYIPDKSNKSTLTFAETKK